MNEEKSVKRKNHKVWICIGAVIAVVGVAIGVIVFLTAKKTKELNEKLQLAQQYFLELDYDQAISTYEEILVIDPKSEAAYDGYLSAGLAKTGEFIDEIMYNYDYTEADCELYFNFLEDMKEHLLTESVETGLEYDVNLENEIALLEEKIAERRDSLLAYEEEQRILHEEELAILEEENRIMKWNSDLAVAEIGDVVNYGHTTDMQKPATWIVLDIEDGYALLFAEKALAYAYNGEVLGDSYVNSTLMPKILFSREQERVRVTDVIRNNSLIMPATDWKYHGAVVEGYGNKLGNYIAGGKYYWRRCGEENVTQSILENTQMFLLSWEDVEKYLMDGKKVYNVNCDARGLGADVSPCELKFNLFVSGSWFIANTMRYEMKFDGDKSENDYLDVVDLNVVISIDEKVNVAVLDSANHTGFVGVRPAMWVKIME